MAQLARARIQMYDRRVQEARRRACSRAFPEAERDEALWPAIKLAYIGLLHEHKQPECAETFYNSVACQVLHRRYYHNEFIFWRPAVATEHLEGEAPTYRCYYPRRTRPAGDPAARSRTSFELEQPLGGPRSATCATLVRALREQFPRPGARAARPADPGAELAFLPQQGRLRRRAG